MSKHQAGAKDQEISETAKAANAEWHPYSVWKATMRKADAVTDDAPAKIESHPNWDPFAVWKRHIKRG